jgi:serine protease Do
MRITAAAAVLALVWASAAASGALTPDQQRALYEKTAASLVVVQYEYDGEGGRRELLGQGLVVKSEGVVMTSMALFPVNFPDAHFKRFKILLPGDEEKEFEAEFLGRDERADLAFIRTKEKQDWPAVPFVDEPVRVADSVYSVGLLPKDAGYKAYLAEATVAARLRGPVPTVLVSTGGLATVGSPVFNEKGNAIGLVQMGFNAGANPFLNSERGAGNQGNSLPSRYFVPAADFIASLSDMPTGKPLSLPWLGANLTGLTKEVAEFYNLKNTPTAQVGAVIPNSPAEKAGLKSGDKIVKFNGQPLERGDEPDETFMILLRKLTRLKPDSTLTLSVIRQKDQPPVDIQVKLEERPMPANRAQRFYDDTLGLAVREVVFQDTYAMRLPADAKGVVVAFIKPSSSAATAGLRNGDFVTQLNKEPVTDLAGFKKQYEDFRKASPKELVVLMVTRGQRTEVIKIEPPQ